MRGGPSLSLGPCLRRGAFAPSDESGFTLIEMLIVLVIIGVAAGAVSLGMGSITRAPSVETEARRLATRLQVASDDAMLGDKLIAFTAEEHGYGFATFGTGGALIPRTDDALGFHQLPSGIVVTLNVKPPIVLGMDGASKPMAATIESGTQRWLVTFDGLTAHAIPAPAI